MSVKASLGLRKYISRSLEEMRTTITRVEAEPDYGLTREDVLNDFRLVFTGALAALSATNQTLDASVTDKALNIVKAELDLLDDLAGDDLAGDETDNPKVPKPSSSSKSSSS